MSGTGLLRGSSTSAWVIRVLRSGPRPRIDRRCIALSFSFPFAWVCYTLIRGAIWKWYPYPFIDVAAHGYARVATRS